MAQDTPTVPFGASAGVTCACLSSRRRGDHRQTRRLRTYNTHVAGVSQFGFYGIGQLCARLLATSRAHTAIPKRIRARNIRIHTSSHALQQQNIIEHRASTHVHRCVDAVFRRASVMYAWCHG